MSNTVKDIFDRMKSKLVNPSSLVEGTFTMDNLQSVANEMGRLYSMEYDRLIDRSHVDTATGSDLDAVGINDHGIKRKKATYEEVNVTIEGSPGTLVDNTISVKSDNETYTVQGSTTIPATGIVSVTARCNKKGAGHTVQAGAINSFVKSYAGLTSVTNKERSAGGYDGETDVDYRNRIYDSEKEEAGYGNIGWYKKIAKEVNGVEEVRVFDLGRGNGTVDIIITEKGNNEASELTLKKVKDNIENKRIVGVSVEVKSAKKINLDVEAEAYISQTEDNVREEFKNKLNEYIQDIELIDGGSKIRISHAKLIHILLECQGVNDVKKLTINGTETSMEIEKDEFPSIKTITLRKVI